MGFDYFYEGQPEKYSFYRIPKRLFMDEEFSTLSTEAKVLYGLLLDRVSLSRENGWLDEDGRIYVFYKMETIREDLRCGNTKACGLLTELERFGLIERVRRGQGKPSLIYVKDFSRFPEREFQNSQNGNSRLLKTGIPDSLVELMLDVLCSNRKTMRIAGDDVPIRTVRERFLKIDSSHMAYVIECMRREMTEVRNIKQYMLAMFYNAPVTINGYYQAMVNGDMARGKI